MKCQLSLLAGLSSLYITNSQAFLSSSEVTFIRAQTTPSKIETIFTRNQKCNLIEPHGSKIHSQLQTKNHELEEDGEGEWKTSWLNMDQLQKLSKQTSLSMDEIQTHHVDVTFYDQSSYLQYFHLRSSSMNCSKRSNFLPDTFQNEVTTITDSAPSTSDTILTKVKHAHDAAIKTYNWCDDFVQNLNLCPWAKQSLLSMNAIRMKIIQQTKNNNSCGWDAMEKIVRESAIELKDLTDEGSVDPYVGITFVVAIPYSNPAEEIVVPANNYDEEDDVDEFDFLTFYDYFNDLEEAFMDENNDEDGENTAFNEVTIAPFHPDWTFAPPSYVDYDHDKDFDELLRDPLDYEKRTPYPTISIVMAKGINLAGEEATAKIGMHNEEVLNELGYEKVRKIYDERVLEKKSSTYLA